jgi:voltage-gated potassium channel
MIRERFRPRIILHPPKPDQVLIRRGLLLLILLCGIISVFWLERDGLVDHHDGYVSFRDVLYFTAVTVSTVGYGDIVPASHSARLIDAAIVTPLRLLMWFIFLGTAYEFTMQRWLEQFRLNQLQKNLKDHLIICGYGHSGQSAAAEALAKGTDCRQIVVLDRDEKRLALAVDAGFIGMRGDACQAAVLRECSIARAKAVLVCVGRDDTAVLAVLSIRQINAGVRIVCNVEEIENAPLITQAGADSTITPALVGGYLMANSIESPRVSDYVNDLISASGSVELIERRARVDEIGKTLRELAPGMAVRIYRGEQTIGFWEGERARVQAQDILLEIEVHPH